MGVGLDFSVFNDHLHTHTHTPGFGVGICVDAVS